jgi:serine/threonine protein phosphatase PrpC
MVPQMQPSPWSVRAACISDVGRVREHNEDRWLIDFERMLFIVSDGMGGHQAGEVASEAVVKVLPPMIEQYMVRVRPSSSKMIEQVLQRAIRELSQRLRTEGKKRVGLQGMGATLVLAWLRGEVAYLAHMGDSRIYLFRNEKLISLTQDHSIVALLVRHGDITPEEARNHPARGRLSRYVGMKDDVPPDVRTIRPQQGDRLLLCSDGLTGMVLDAQIEELLQANPETEAACQALVTAANEAGGTDNITVLVVNCEARFASQPPQSAGS